MDENNKKKFYTVYKTTNLLNEKIYIGIHETYNSNDNYMGSGVVLNRSIKKHGKENFKKEILFLFDNKKEMLEKEKELVNEVFIKRKDTYNCIIGGVLNTSGFANVKDKDGNCFLVDVDDPRILSGELSGITKGFVNVRDENGKTFQVTKKEYDLNDNLKNMTFNKVLVFDENLKKIWVDKEDSRYLSGELVSINMGIVICFDKNGKSYRLSVDSKEWKSGNYKTFFKGKKHTEETKRKIGKTNSTKQKGENNSQFGKCWIYSLKEKRNLKISYTELENYLSNDWIKGRKMIF